MSAEGMDWYFELIDQISSPAKAMSKATGGLEDHLKAVDRVLKSIDRDSKKLKLNKALGLDLTKEQAAETRRQLQGLSAQRLRASMRRDELRAMRPAKPEKREGSGLEAGAQASIVVGAVGEALGVAWGLAKGFAGAIHDAVSYAVELNSQVESTRIAIAGMMQAGGLTRGLDLQMADRVMDRIRRDAAKLPGEAEDFVAVFRAALPKAIAAGMSDVGEIAKFTNSVAAVGITLGEDAPQIGRDLNLLLSGRAGAANALWTRLSENISKAGRELGITVNSAKDFNHVRPEQRLQLVQQAIRGYDDAIAAFGDTWEAVQSTFTSALKDMVRFGGLDIFQGVKGSLKTVNDWMERHEILVRTVSGLVGTLFGNAWRMVTRAIGGVKTRDLIVAFARVYSVVHALAAVFSNQIWPIVQGLGSGFLQGLVAGLAPLAGLLKALASTKTDVGVWQALGRFVGFSITMFVGLFAIIQRLTTFIPQLASKMWSLGTDLVMGLWNGIQAGWNRLISGFQELVQDLPETVQTTLAISSPSRVMEELGGFTAQGFEQGIRRGMGGVNSAMGTLANPPEARSGGRGFGDVHIEIHVDGAGRNGEEIAGEIESVLVSFFERMALEGGL